MAPQVPRLKKRSEFQAAARGGRQSKPGFLLQVLDRGDDGGPRFGFTVTRKTGHSVERNRIRRRLREAVRLVAPACARPGHDYVLVGRRPALTVPFADLVADLADSLAKTKRRAAPGRSGRGPERPVPERPVDV